MKEKCPFFVAFCMELLRTSLVSGRICQKTQRRSSQDLRYLAASFPSTLSYGYGALDKFRVIYA